MAAKETLAQLVENLTKKSGLSHSPELVVQAFLHPDKGWCGFLTPRQYSSIIEEINKERKECPFCGLLHTIFSAYGGRGKEIEAVTKAASTESPAAKLAAEAIRAIALDEIRNSIAQKIFEGTELPPCPSSHLASTKEVRQWYAACRAAKENAALKAAEIIPD